MNRQQMTNLIGAGTITGVLLLIALLFGGGPRTSAAQASTSGPATGQVESAPADAATLAQENAALRQAVDTLLSREQQYADQLQQANDALAQQAAPAAGYAGEYEEYEEHEHDDGHEYEHEDEHE